MIFTTTRVRFPSGSDVLVGDLHQPQGQDTESATTIVIVTGSWTTVKEQQADFYARRLAAAGLNTLVFDFRGFGQSEGNPR
ncbi:MAG: alpha/beta hydrolase, partial [Corynebacterium matruchotii]